MHMYTKQDRLCCLDNRIECRYLRYYAAVLHLYKQGNVNIMTTQPASKFDTEHCSQELRERGAFSSPHITFKRKDKLTLFQK
jgi:hypothetical protein